MHPRIHAKPSFCLTACILLFAAGGIPTIADAVPLTVWESPSGVLYALSPGVEGGSCTPAENAMHCTAPEGDSGAAASTLGCGRVSGRGFCLTVPPDWTPPAVLPYATSTLECKDRNYELSVDGGRCTPNNGEHMECSDGGVNRAIATCEKGCGVVTGSGSCKPGPKPRN